MLSPTPVLTAGRAVAAGRMTDACTVTRPGVAVFNATTGNITSGPGTSLYAGPCRVKRETAPERQVEAGEAPVLLRRYVVSVPMSVLGVQPNDVVAVTASGDSDLLNVTLEVLDVGRGTNVSARRLLCEEQT